MLHDLTSVSIFAWIGAAAVIWVVVRGMHRRAAQTEDPAGQARKQAARAERRGVLRAMLRSVPEQFGEGFRAGRGADRGEEHQEPPADGKT